MAKNIRFDINVIGAEQISAALSDPALVGAPLRELLTDAGKLARRTGELAIDGGLGRAVRTINFFVNPLSMRTTTVLPRARARSIEKGRKAGGPMPPLGQIQNWRTGSVAAGRGPITNETWVLARAIRRRGVKGRFFMRAAQEAVKNATPRLIAEMTARIEAHWKAAT